MPFCNIYYTIKKEFIVKKKIFAILLCIGLAFTIVGCKKLSTIEKVSQDLNEYSILLDYNHQENAISGTETIEFTNRYDVVLPNIKMHLYPRAFSETAVNRPVSKLNEANAYPQGVDYGDIEIENVILNDNVVTPQYEGQDNDILTIEYEIEPYDKVEISIEFEIDMPRVNHRFGYGDNTINIANFYPILCVYENGEYNTSPYDANGDPFYSDVANYNVTLEYDSNYIVAHTGYETNKENLGDRTILDMSAKAVRDFAIVMSDKFSVVSKDVGDTRVNYFYYDQDNAEAYLKTSTDALSTFEKLFGEYPYDSLNVVRSNFVHGGMEYPNLVYISDEVEGVENYNNVIIHEIAHQWWYGVVGNNEYDYAWLDEGLTEYSTLLFYEENPDYNIDYNEIIKNATNNYVTFVDLYKEVIGTIDTSMSRPINKYDTEYEYVYMTYVKGMLFFDNLRDVVGKNKFYKGLQDYYIENAYKIATPANLLSSMEHASHTKLGSFFDSWIEGKVIIGKIS